MTKTPQFWREKTLSDLSKSEWESLCDGCGLCCLHKLRDEDTETLLYTNVACRLLDLETCRCAAYQERFVKVPDCIALTPKNLADIDWLPRSCAYRLVKNGEDLPSWHPLKTGRAESVHEAGITGRGRMISERRAGPLEHHIVDWPSRASKPKAIRPRKQPRAK